MTYKINEDCIINHKEKKYGLLSDTVELLDKYQEMLNAYFILQTKKKEFIDILEKQNKSFE